MFKRKTPPDLKWQERAIAAEAQLAIAKEGMAGLELLIKQRASLVSIARNGRKIRFLFQRNDKLISVECMGTWDDDVEGWKRELFE